MVEIDELLRHAVQRGASDVHIKVGSRPYVRIDGRLAETEFDQVTPGDTERIAFAIMPKQRADEFLTTNEADFAYAVAGLGRFRVNVFRQRGSVGLVLRRVLPGIPSFEALGLPPVVRRLAEEPRGLVLVTGPTGSGKTTTLAAMIDHINETQRRHIVTIEDPIEVLHPDKQSIVNQREIGTDTDDFHSALKRVLRQDPDVVLIGEMRDPETVWAAIAAAETGHLVLSTLHTISATDTINRIIDFFPPHQQRQVRMSVASALRGIVSQRLLDRGTGRDGSRRSRSSWPRAGCSTGSSPPTRPTSSRDIIAEGEFYGMQTFDQSLLGLYRRGMVGRREALATASHPHDLRLKMEQVDLERRESEARSA
ncbi:MAG: PilT/PilU family type 4a pilus ATPase [Acidimicrobiia bacterium]|nr:PilT/PilU family type 4a pilus ATPase [Acidimicrobiia bacterium]